MQREGHSEAGIGALGESQLVRIEDLRHDSLHDHVDVSEGLHLEPIISLTPLRQVLRIKSKWRVQSVWSQGSSHLVANRSS